MAEIRPGSELKTFINIFTCEPADQRALLDTLGDETTQVVSKVDGFVSASLHASTDGRRVINYAQWTDLTAFTKMMSGPQGKELIQAVHRCAKAVDIHMYEVDWALEASAEAATANALAERAWELIRSGRVDDLAEVFAPDAEMSIAAMSGTGIDYITGVMGRHVKSYPDIKHELLAVVESPDGRSACRELRFEGTHAGELRNPQTGEVYPPSGRSLSWHAAEVVYAAAGKITAWHAYFDRMEIAQQLRGTSS